MQSNWTVWWTETSATQLIDIWAHRLDIRINSLNRKIDNNKKFKQSTDRQAKSFASAWDSHENVFFLKLKFYMHALLLLCE